MDNLTTNTKVKCFILCFILASAVILSLHAVNIKPMIKNITYEELNAIHGIKIEFGIGSVDYGPIAESIISYIELYPNAKVEDLRIIKGVDDMILDQLKERWR